MSSRFMKQGANLLPGFSGAAAGGGGGGFGTATKTLSGGFTPQTSFPLSNAFDNDTSTAFAANEQGPANIDFAFTGSGDIVEVRLTRSTNVGGDNNMALHVGLYYSDAGTTYTQKGATQDLPYPATGVQTLSFPGSVGSHSYWRLTITAAFNQLVLAEIELASTAAGADILG